MRKLFTIAAIIAALATAGAAGACNTGSHGTDNPACPFSNYNGSPQYTCYAGQERDVPATSQGFEATIRPVSVTGSPQPFMNGAVAVSYWVMLTGNGIGPGRDSWIQVGYIMEPVFGVPSLYYFLDIRNGVGCAPTGCTHQQYNLWAWPNDGGHRFKIWRDAGTTNYHVTIDGTEFWGGPFNYPGINVASQRQVADTESVYYSNTAACSHYKAQFQNLYWKTGFTRTTNTYWSWVSQFDGIWTAQDIDA